MKVLMLGWEFPPFISGGLGTACYGLTRALSQMGTEVIFVLPKPITGVHATHVKMAHPHALGRISGKDVFGGSELARVIFRTLPSMMTPYQTPQDYEEALRKARQLAGESFGLELDLPDIAGGDHYGRDLYQEVQRYAKLAAWISREEEFDVIHAHDWMTYPAGMAVSALSGKPLVVHIHSTEFDRSGEHVNQMVYDIERQGMHAADKVIAVSHLTKNIVVNRYAVPAEKVEVVYNAIDRDGSVVGFVNPGISKDEKIVLFLGRITMQKGPEYFLAAAKKVLEVMDNVKFVMAGSGDMIRRTIEMAAEMGIGHKVLFTGFLRGKDVDRVFQMADLFVMPSVSEPFGLVPLEALRNDVPVIISKQSGVAEVLTHALKVDFWDINEMANKIVAVLRHPPLHSTLREHGNFEVRKFNWTTSAQQVMEVYRMAQSPVAV
ncbi:MAG: glycosyltransferase family 4 protein [Sedimentisphaerales bacterium]|nr:glycosyltransferase family 4 protein [Sedimentisphaerales bacterium]